MLPTQTWYEASAIEPSPANRPRRRHRARRSFLQLRRAIGHRLIAVGHAVAADAARVPEAARR